MRTRIIFYSTLAFLLLALLILSAGPSSIQIRTDTGDLRFNYLRIPLYHDRLPESDRSALLSIANLSPKIQPTWITVPPNTTSNNNASSYQHFYRLIAAWAAADPTVARFLLEDNAAHLTSPPGAPRSTPNGAPLLMLARYHDTIPPDWFEYPEIQTYCEQHHYTRPEWSTPTRHPKGPPFNHARHMRKQFPIPISQFPPSSNH